MCAEVMKCDNREETELWDIIKTRILTKVIVSAYANTLLLLILNVHLSLVGKIKCHEEEENVTSSNDSSFDMLSRSYHYFFNNGIASLCQTVKKAIEGSKITTWNVMNSMMELSEEE